MKPSDSFSSAVSLTTFILVTLLVAAVTEAPATTRAFGAGSYIIAADSCWQPNNDTGNTVANAAYCDTNKNDQSLFQLFGLLYALLDVGDQPDRCVNNDGSVPQQKALFGYCKQIKAYWIIDNGKNSSQDPDLTLISDVKPIVTVYNSTKTGTVAPMSNYVTKADSGTAGSISYRGGPFVIDVNDMTTAELNIVKAKFPSVKIHKTNISFSGNVDKVLVGKPPRVAVLNEGASDVLEDYIRAAGLFSWRNTVFQYVSSVDIMNGCLDDPIPSTCSAERSDIAAPFTLLWAPHWIVDSAVDTVEEQKLTIRNIRKYLERGNSGFFECASIESIEGSASGGISVGSDGGFTIGSNKATPRIETNGGCSDGGKCSVDYLKFEQAPFWLVQCGGWNYQATGGHVHNLRPSLAKSYSYLTTLTANDNGTTPDDRYVGSQFTRFIHDDTTKLNNSYIPGAGAAAGYYAYDYLVGGRINGIPGEGYVAYLPGHKYIGCSNSTTYDYPPSRTLDFSFNMNPPSVGSIFIELVHTGCTQGSSCPKVQYNLGTGSGTRSTTGGKVDLNAELASFDSGTSTLSGVQFTSSDPTATANLQITDFYVTFDGNGGMVKLTNVTDLTEIDKRQSLCAPNQSSSGAPVRCSLWAPASMLTLTFGNDISSSLSKLVSVKLPFAGGSVTARFDLSVNSQGSGAVNTVGNLTLDMSSASYDPATHTLTNILVKRGATCADVTLTDIQVTFPGNGKLSLVYNDTTSQAVCSPDQLSPATCSGAIIPPSYSIATQLTWAGTLTLPSKTPPEDASLTLNYTCTPACSTTTITAQRGSISSNADMTLDFQNVSVSATALSNIMLTIMGIDKSVKLTTIILAYTGSTATAKAVTYKNTTNNVVLFTTNTKTSPPIMTVNKTIPLPTITIPPSTWSYLLGKGICSYYISPYLSSCTIDWTKSNTCGIKYVLNTLLALKFQTTTSEFSKTQPLVLDNILYKASYDYPSYRGHLKMLKVPTDTQTNAVTVWDAANSMPPAGTGNFPTAPLRATNPSSLDLTTPRYIFTNLPDKIDPIRFDPGGFDALDATSKAAFRTQIGVGAVENDTNNNNAKVIINTVRGRTGASTANTSGTDQDTMRLWAIENSTPALKTRSKFVESTAAAVSDSALAAGKDRRDRVLFAGGDDGMLHAFWAGTYDPVSGTYPDYDSKTAEKLHLLKEIWAYIPSALLSNLNKQPFNPDPTNEASFEPKVSVDGSPALGDFLILNTTSNKWEWKTRLVGTAMVRSENRAVLFSLDVTDPYNPQLLWESSYDKSSDTACSGTLKNCNMGNSKGVAIGTVQIGSQLKDYLFLTSSWINKKNVTKIDTVTKEYATCTLTDTAPTCVYGVTAYALDLDTGKVIWAHPLPYTDDAVGINETPAVPALMDRDNNGSYDYLVFGDMQGRLWALRTADGKNLTDSNPVYQVKEFNADGSDSSTPTGAKEPIGAAVSVYRDYVVLATGGADVASNGSATDARKYRVEVIKIGITGGVKDNNQTVLLAGYDGTTKKGNEKVWAKPAITSDLKIYIGTARSYYNNQTVATLESDGRVIVIDLRVKRDTVQGITNVAVVGGGGGEWFSGGFVGGFDFDHKHAYIVTLKPTITANTKTSVLQIGAQSDFTSTTSQSNPFKILWWRKM